MNLFRHAISSLLLLMAFESIVVWSLIEAPKCETCKGVIQRFKEGLEKTAKSNFGGGNTNWEERKLGSFANSETRFLEVLEQSCEASSKECHHMLEEHEEVLEQWFFLEYARGLDTDLLQYFCIEKLKVCCPQGTFGASCAECPGGKDRPCTGNGQCEGDGTRGGTGRCSCTGGYSGTLCSDCADGYFEENRNDSHVQCQSCHRACNGSCSGPDRKDCSDCQSGWQWHETEGCTDVDECSAGETRCSDNQYCSNSEGSYACIGCSDACDGCTGAGPENCKSCSAKHVVQNGVCTKCHSSCANSCLDDTPATCDSCAEGWRLGEDNQCQDINECDEKLSVCEGHSYCVNLPGSSTCASCHRSCQGCSGPSAADCVQCSAGFAVSTTTYECSDIDECTEGTPCASTSEKCVNTVGSYRCECADGFVRKNGKCEPKKKTAGKKEEKQKTKQSEQSQPDFDKSSLTKGLGNPIEGKPLNEEEMIVMEGKLNSPTNDNLQSEENDRHEL